MGSLLCLPILVRSVDGALADAAAARDAGADLVEWRIDALIDSAARDATDEMVEPVLRLVLESPIACVLTCRGADDGGHFSGPDSTRAALLWRVIEGSRGRGPRFVDIEQASLERSEDLRRLAERIWAIEEAGPTLIVSIHDFQGRPADLTRRLVRLHDWPWVRILKVAFRARSLRDNLELAEIIARSDRPVIALGIGEYGLPSRVLAPRFGGFLTFASLRDAAATAPGQPTIADLLGLYRFRSIGPGTRVYGVVGHPVGHSLSPMVHNAGFEAVGHDGVYLPMPVAPGFESLKATLLEMIHDPRLGLAGVSVTLPHKEDLVRLALEQGWILDPLCRAIGAGNTISVERDATGEPGAVRVSNTDAPAAVRCIEAALGGSVRGERIGLMGAGGVARAVAAGLARAGALVHVSGRTRARVEALVGDLAGLGSVRACTEENLEASGCRVYVNCTPVGMAGGPSPESSPIDVARISRRDALVFDTVYTPVRTPLLIQAERAGLATIDGVEMFVRQAAAQFRIWTGSDAPAGLFDRICREQLGG